jgi:hypothetical protein
MPRLCPKKNEVDKDGKLVYQYTKPTPWILSPIEFQTVLGIMKNACASNKLMIFFTL